jgi:hypothetical protein
LIFGGTYGVAVAAGDGTLSDFGAVPVFAGLFIDFDLARGLSSDVEVVDLFDVFDFDVGTKCTDTGFGFAAVKMRARASFAARLTNEAT